MQKKGKSYININYNDFGEKKTKNSFNNSKNANSINQEIKPNKNKKLIKVSELKPIRDYIMSQRRTKSEEKKLYILQYEYYNDIIEKETKIDINDHLRKFKFDLKTIKKYSNKNEVFPLFSDIANKKESFLEKNIKNFIKDSSILHSYKCIFSKNDNLKNIEIAPLIETQEAFNLNIYRLKSGVNNYIHNFEKIILFKYNFSFDNNYISKLDPFVDNENDTNLNYFSKDNQIFTAYRNKYIKGMNISTEEDIIKPLEEIKIDNDNDIYGSIDKINQRWLNKKKCTRIISRPDIDNYKLHLYLKNCLEIPLISQAFNEFVKQKIKSTENDNITIQKPIIDSTFDELTLEIFRSFKEDNITINKIKFNTEIIIHESIETINNIYNNKNVLNMEIVQDYSPHCNINIDILNDVNININYEKFKKWKEDKINKKNKYICSGDASIELMKSNLKKDKFNNPQTSLLHNLSLQLNEINSKNMNDINNNNLNLTMNKSANFNFSKCAKKLKDEIDLSLSNKNTFNSKLVSLNKLKSERLRMKKKLSSINSKNDENLEKNNEYENIMRQMKKSENDMNKKRKKIYINKIKAEQENNFDQEIKRDKKYNMIYPILIVIISLLFSTYKHFSNED